MKKIAWVIIVAIIVEAFNIVVIASDYDSWSSEFVQLWSDDFEEYPLGRVEGKKNTSLSANGLTKWKATTGSAPFETVSIVNSPLFGDGRGKVLSFEGRMENTDGKISFSGANNLEFQSSSDRLREETKVKVSFDLYMESGRYFQLRLFGASKSELWNVFTVKDDCTVYVSGAKVGTLKAGQWHRIDVYIDFESSLCDVYMNKSLLKGGVKVSDISCLTYGRLTVYASEVMAYLDNFEISLPAEPEPVNTINDNYTLLWEDTFESYDADVKANNLYFNGATAWNAGGGSGKIGVEESGAGHGKVIDFNAANIIQTQSSLPYWEHINSSKRIKLSFDFYSGQTDSVTLYMCGTNDNSKRMILFQIKDDESRTMRFNGGAYSVATASNSKFADRWHNVTMYYDFDTMTSTVYYDYMQCISSKGFTGPECFYKLRFEYPTSGICVDNVRISVLNPVWEDDFEDYDIKAYTGKIVHGSDVPSWQDSNSNGEFDVIDFGSSHGKVLSLRGVFDNKSNLYINGNTVASYSLKEITKPYSCTVETDVYFEDYRYSELRLVGNNENITVAKFNKNGYVGFPNTSGVQVAYNTQNWYTVAVDVDLSTKFYSVRLNGNTVIDNMQFESDSLFVEGVMFQAGSSDPVKAVYLDNVKIFADVSDITDALSEERMVLSFDDYGNVNVSASTKEHANKLIVATYKDDKLINVELLDDVRGPESGYENLFTHTLPSEEGITVKGFWLDSVENMIPERPYEVIQDISDSDFMYMLNLWGNYLLGSGADKGEAVSYKTGKITSLARQYMDSMNKDTSKNYLWDTCPLDSTSNMTSTYKNIFCMALAWGTKGSELYHNQALLEAVKYSVEYMYNNCYGECALDETAALSVWKYNWWDWMVGTPQYLLDTMVILRSEYSQEETERYTSLFGYINSAMYVQANKKYTQEKAYAACLYAVLSKDKQLLKDMLNRYSLLFEITQSGNGVYDDYSYLYHNNVPYTSVYGVYFDRTLPVMSIMEEYNLCNTSSFYNFVADYILNGFEPLIYNGGLMAMNAGRNFGKSTEQYNSVTLVRSIIDIIDYVDDQKRDRLKKLVKRTVENSGMNIFYSDSRMFLYHVAKLEQILNDKKVPNEDYVGSKVFYNMDRTVWHRGEYAIGLAMSSSRIANYESCNHRNEKGWYTGDGMLYLYLENDKTQFDTDYEIYADPYKRPGTTVDTQVRKEASIKVGEEYFSSQDFVGGAVIDGLYSVSAMALESFHNEKKSDEEDTGAGGGLPVHISSLVAKKSYFMFDNEIVCLGSDIDANDGYDVLTVVENRKLLSDFGNEEILIDGLSSGDKGNEPDAKSAFLEGVGGYYFPYGENIKWQKNKNVKTFFEMWIDHAMNPDNEKYCYVILPALNPEQTEAYANNPDVIVLRNDESVHAVTERILGITGMVFWNASKVDGVEVFVPLIVIRKNTENGVVLSVSDPTHKLNNAVIKIDGKYTGVETLSNIQIDTKTDYTEINIDFTDISGESICFELVRN